MITTKQFNNPLEKAWKKQLDIVFDDTAQNPVCYTLSQGQLWSLDIARVAHLFIDSNSTILDCGAHIGTFSTLMASITKKKVISIEADPKNFELVLQNKEANGFNHQICYNVAASDKAGVLKFCTNGPSGHVLEEGGQEAYIEVQAIPIDSILNDNYIDLIKIDVEGWEINAIKGLDKTIKKSSPVIIFEVNGFTLKWFDLTPNDLLRALEEYDYQVFIIGNALTPINSFEPFPYGVVDAVAVKKQNIQNIKQFIGLPLTKSERDSIFASTYYHGNQDIRGYVDWYSAKLNG